MNQTLKKLITLILSGYGYRLVKAPKKAIIDDPEANLVIDLDYAVFHHLEKNNKRPLQIVQIGAYDGVNFQDPIHAYLKDPRFQGLLVEPQPQVFTRLQMNYQGYGNVCLENAAIANELEKTTLYTIDTENSDLPGWLEGCASLNEEVISKYERRFPNLGEHLQTITVPSMPLGCLLEKHKIKAIDLLQIDAEGYDFEVIKMLDFQSLKPAIIHFERNHLSPVDREECYVLLIDNGYKIAIEGRDVLAYTG